MKPHKIFFLLCFCIYLQPTKTLAHLGSIVGQVFQKNSNQPLQGANIQLVNTHYVATTDVFGSYKLTNLPAGQYQIEISHVGFETQKIQVTLAEDQTYLQNINLIEGEITLAETKVKSIKNTESQLIGKIDFGLKPLNNSQEVLRLVPGLFIGQHAGGGKAEQIFLRGFDIDHGTDVQITADGMPVNMVSHAHGQGYADMHFVIPELIQAINYKKGPYTTAKGNFSTAGWVDITTKNVIENNLLKLELGQFNSYRALGMLNLLGAKAKSNKQNAYLAGEYTFTNGYFENPQHFNRRNIQANYHGHWGKNSLFTATASTFSSSWAASGQIPNRAVAAGQIGYFGAIDPTEGGQTARSSINLRLASTLGQHWLLQQQLFYSKYNFTLYSNFTFFLNDSINGDQIRQKENRDLLGYTTTAAHIARHGKTEYNSTFGLNIRHDATKDTELSHTLAKKNLLNVIQLGQIQESNLALYFDETIQLDEKLTINAGIRYDHFLHQYTDKLLTTSKQASIGIWLPKLNLTYTTSPRNQLYLNMGRGFHSNDSRVVVQKLAKTTLPAAYGLDLGVVTKPLKNSLLNLALWYLYLQQEFVYVGDAGIVEPSSRSIRYGLDLSARQQVGKNIFFNLDYTYTHPRAINEAEGNQYIPLAPINTLSYNMAWVQPKGFNLSVNARVLGQRPANENFSIVAKGYFLADANAAFIGNKYVFNLNIQNIFNTKWKETQFATNSRLAFESSPVEEIHFTPGSPFFAKFSISRNF
jgi:hypothetical protein